MLTAQYTFVLNVGDVGLLGLHLINVNVNLYFRYATLTLFTVSLMFYH